MKELRKLFISALAVMVMAGGMALTSNGGLKNVSAETDPAGSAAVSAESKNTISVYGTGTVKVAPDIATVSIGVTTQDVSSKKAVNDNNTQMNDLMKSIKDLGIADKDITTNGFNIYPNYAYDSKTGESKVSGYQVSNTVTVKVRDLTKVSAVIDAAVAAGANVSNGVQFSVADPDKAYNDALALAVTNAKTKADVIAKALNVKISTPKAITEMSTGGGSYYSNYNMPANAVFDERMDTSSTPISSGEIVITAQVSANYEY